MYIIKYMSVCIGIYLHTVVLMEVFLGEVYRFWRSVVDSISLCLCTVNQRSNLCVRLYYI